MRLDGPWLELAVPVTLALVATLLHVLTPDAQGEVGGQPWATVPDELEVRGSDGTAFRLLLHRQPPLLADAEGRPLGRLDAREAKGIATELAEARILRELPRRRFDEQGLGALGWGSRLELRGGGETWILCGDGADRAYLIDDARVRVLDRDLAALLDRRPESLRAADLDLPDRIHRIAGRDWALATARNRLWLQRTGQETADWTDNGTITTWLHALAVARPLGFTAPEQVLTRAELRFAGRDDDGREREVVLADLGPAAGGGRQVRRSETQGGSTLMEDLVLVIDAAVFDPDPAGFASRAVLPLDPLRADRVRVGRIELTQQAGQWRLQGADDADQAQIQAVLKQLASLERDPTHATPTPADIMVEHAGERCGPAVGDARLNQFLAQLKPWHLRDRRLLPDLSAAAVTGLVFAPQDGAPQVYSREAVAAWPPEYAAELTLFLDRLLSAGVERWTGSCTADAAPPFTAEASISLATVDAQYTLRLDAQGQVQIPQRGLIGQLDATAVKRLLE